MDCTSIHGRLHAFLDGELRESEAAAIRDHLAICASCLAEAEDIRLVESRIRAALSPVPETEKLWRRISAALERDRESQPSRLRRRWWYRSVLAAGAIAASVLVGVMLWQLIATRPSGDNRPSLASVPVMEFQTYIESRRSMDVATADPAQLRSWFATRVDFTPPAPPAPSGRLELLGGRLCYFFDRRVASYMYRFSGHLVSLYVMRGDGLDFSKTARERRSAVLHAGGFTDVVWTKGDFLFFLVSDLSEDTLLQIAAAFGA
jgi:anti-sigma factor RsiW